MLKQSSKSDHTFTEGIRQKERVDEITITNREKLENDMNDKERKSFQLVIKNRPNKRNTLDEDLEGAKQASRERKLLYPHQPTQPPPKSIGTKSREQSREKYGKAPSTPKAGINPYGHQELTPNIQNLQSNATTPMQTCNATQRAGDNVTNSSIERSRAGTQRWSIEKSAWIYENDAAEAARQQASDNIGAARRYSGQSDDQMEAAEKNEDAV